MREYSLQVDVNESRAVYVCMLYENEKLESMHYFRLDDEELAKEFGRKWEKSTKETWKF